MPTGGCPVLSCTKKRRIPSTKSGKNRISTTYEPTSSLQKNHLAPATSAIVDNDKRQ
jgi:hypothetical protein